MRMTRVNGRKREGTYQAVDLNQRSVLEVSEDDRREKEEGDEGDDSSEEVGRRRGDGGFEVSFDG